MKKLLRLKNGVAFLLLGTVGVSVALAQSSDLGDRMSRIAAENRANERSTEQREQEDDDADQEFLGNQGFIISGAISAGNCPSWETSSYAACECESAELPTRDAKLAWRSACGVMALDRFSQMAQAGLAPLQCELKSEWANQVRERLSGAGVINGMSYAENAWDAWKNGAGCRGQTSPSKAPQEELICASDEVAISSNARSSQSGEILCSNGVRKRFEIELLRGHVFRIKDENGGVSMFNASRVIDPQTGANLLDAEFVSASICNVQADPAMVAQLKAWLQDYLGENSSSPPFVSSRIACIGVRG